MREIRYGVVDVDDYLEQAARAKQQLDADHWRGRLRPRAMRLFAARATKLTWSRALVKLILEELFPDDLFTELVGNARSRAVAALAAACSRSRSHSVTAGVATV